MYVLYIKTNMQDGEHECTVLFNSVEDAVAYIQERANWKGDRETFRLFSIGVEIPLIIYDVVEVRVTHDRIKRVEVLKQGQQTQKK